MNDQTNKANSMRSISLPVLGLVLVFAAALALPDTPALAAGLTVTKTADTNDGVCNADCSLREAVLAANAGGGFYDSITIPPGTYVLTIAGPGEDAGATGDLDVTVPLTIAGAGAGSTIIDGNGAAMSDRVLQVNNGDVFALSGVTIRNGGNLSTGIDGAGIHAVGEIQHQRQHHQWKQHHFNRRRYLYLGLS